MPAVPGRPRQRGDRRRVRRCRPTARADAPNPRHQGVGHGAASVARPPRSTAFPRPTTVLLAPVAHPGGDVPGHAVVRVRSTAASTPRLIAPAPRVEATRRDPSVPGRERARRAG
ncbi:hypothetical protein FTX61_07570 [Nitriliruptoraceae bacterium ZYF776]|nr:hypothetical protein [Profundirhabdus halotolerans]